VARETDTADRPGGAGTFGWLGDFVVRWPWLVIGIWLALAAVMPLTFPSLTQMAQERPIAILPANAPSTITAQQMDDAFGELGSENIALVVLTNENGLGPADETVYATLVDRLRRDAHDVVMVQDFLSAPPLREVLASKDNKAWLLPVSLAGRLGTPQAYGAYTRVAGIVKHGVAGSTVTAYMAGPAATVADLTQAGDRDRVRIEIALLVMLLIILMVIYRNPVTMLLPLVTIGVSLVVAQSVVALFGALGLGVSNQTIVFLSALIAGAGTDYAVFLIGRYHDYVRLGLDSDDAVKKALSSIGKVIAASAATVAVTFLAMSMARLPVLATVGVALAVGICMAFLAAITLLPAILSIAGPRGWITPRRDLTSRFWRRSGIRIVRRPKAHLVASVIVLAILATCAGLAKYNYDDRKALPNSVESSIGYAATDRHFSASSTVPQYLVIQSPHDLRTPEALADLEQMAQRVSQLRDIAVVRGITRPTGQSLNEAKATYQAGEVGGKLRDASNAITGRTDDLNLLAGGADLLADNLGNVRGQVVSAIANVRGLIEALSYIQKVFGGGSMLRQIENANNLITAMRAFGDALGVNFANGMDMLAWVDPVLAALDTSSVCAPNPVCVGARDQLQRLATARDNGAFTALADLARLLQSTQDTQSIDSTMQGLQKSLDTVSNAMRSLGIEDSGDMNARLTTMRTDADKLADVSRKLADGVQQLVDQTKRMGAGLDEASAFLLAMKHDAAAPSMAGFNIPPQVLYNDDFQKVAKLFISPDGHTVRYFIQTNLSPFSTEAMEQVNSITDIARGAQPNTALADASISMAGYPATLRDTRDYYNHDIWFIIAITILVVLFVLVTLLRAIVAPLYLVGSVIISCLSALGIGVVVFQFILGQQLHWSVTAFAFIILVAVGADYNMLLIARLRDESVIGIRSGVIRTVGSTGGAITAAGLIFAASMFGLLFASVTTVIQAGFVVGVGILLDTFLVRTITVPAIAVLAGRANWWPSRWKPRSKADKQPDAITADAD
jgi:putative drug exporter of the RND superfamily